MNEYQMREADQVEMDAFVRDPKQIHDMILKHAAAALVSMRAYQRQQARLMYEDVGTQRTERQRDPVLKDEAAVFAFHTTLAQTLALVALATKDTP